MRRLALFAAVLAVFGVRHLSWISDRTAEWLGLATPFAVVAAAAAVLAQLKARGASLAVAIVGGILYVDGHGMHLAADSIRSEGLSGEAERVAHFWDERLSHWELHSGLILVVVAFCLAEAQARVPVTPVVWAAVSTVVLLGVTLFAGVVEGGTWWLLPPAAVALGVWAFLRARPLPPDVRGGLRPGPSLARRLGCVARRSAGVQRPGLDLAGVGALEAAP